MLFLGCLAYWREWRTRVHVVFDNITNIKSKLIYMIVEYVFRISRRNAKKWKTTKAFSNFMLNSHRKRQPLSKLFI